MVLERGGVCSLIALRTFRRNEHNGGTPPNRLLNSGFLQTLNMTKAFLAVFAISIIPALGLAAEQGIPKDVSTFMEERESCDHWRGEEGYDKERRAEIDWSICQSCVGTDSRLALLKKKYQADKTTMAKLAELEPSIEPDDKVATKRFCRGLKKPKSLDEDQ